MECLDPSEALIYFKEYRLSRGMNSSVEGTFEGAVRDRLESEYRKEFYGEGQYFYFMKRTKIDNWDGKELGELQYVLPLPDSESKYRK